MSLAIIDSIPNSCAATSPAFPCMNTPNKAASAGVYRCARSDNIIPVKTSPLPAVAIPGLPVELKKHVPFGNVMAVCAPFCTIIILCTTLAGLPEMSRRRAYGRKRQSLFSKQRNKRAGASGFRAI